MAPDPKVSCVLAKGATQNDSAEIREWLDSLEAVLEHDGPERARFLLTELKDKAIRRGVHLPFTANTPYINTIPPDQQPVFPGSREIERRIKSLVRWNAMAMVVRANKRQDGIGGHISSYASSATLYEVGFNHFFRGPEAPGGGDLVFFQGHAAPGIYARAFLEGRLTLTQLDNFRRELQPGGGLSSYPHPWLMPHFWQFPTVSMGLGPIMAIYQARFNRYLEHRGLVDTSRQKVWCFLGDGETDEPESLGALTLAAREGLDNLIFVVNCNLQRLDGPVRGNGKIIQELEAAFRGAGWNVIKVIWGSDWDPLLAKDKSGLLVRRMGEVVDGEYQKYAVESGRYIREQFFGKYPELLQLVEHLSDEQLRKLSRGGHDPEKVYAAYQAALEHPGAPTCILAHTIKGYGLGEAGEGRNITHQQKKLNEEELREFRARFNIPISDEHIAEAPFYRPPADSREMRYLHERRQALGGYLPVRQTDQWGEGRGAREDAETRRHGDAEIAEARGERQRLPLLSPCLRVSASPRLPSSLAPHPSHLAPPPLEVFQAFFKGSGEDGVTSTAAFVSILNVLLSDKNIGKLIVPIIPDEARTFGMDPLFSRIGIYSNVGQRYEPVDANTLKAYRERKDGQLLEEGITEAGSMSSFIAAATSYATHGLPTIPFFIYYSMFGFQRIGDLVLAASDMRARGFMLGGTAGRTTLNGEGLQHEDGQSHLLASVVPTLVAYDPAFAYELAIIIQDGIHRMYAKGEDAIFYITLYNEKYRMPALPESAREGILKGLYKLRPANQARSATKLTKIHLFGSGPILLQVMRAQELLGQKFGLAADVWSATSYRELRREALDVERWNMLHPTAAPRVSFVEEVLQKEKGIFLAATDYMRQVPEMISRWVPGGLHVLGTDGFGRSDSRGALRRFFEVDAESIALAALYQLGKRGEMNPEKVEEAIKELGIDPGKPNPLRA